MFDPRVLIIDDDDLIAIALYEHLVASSIDVDLATDPARAEDLMREHRYGLVLVDAYLTGLLHDRAADLVKLVDRLCPDARIMLLSAYGSEQLAQAVSGTREIATFPKPQSVVYLGEVIRGFVSHGTIPSSSASA